MNETPATIAKKSPPSEALESGLPVADCATTRCIGRIGVLTARMGRLAWFILPVTTP